MTSYTRRCFILFAASQFLFIVSLSFAQYFEVGSFPLKLSEAKGKDLQKLKIALIYLETIDKVFGRLSRPRYGRSTTLNSEKALDVR
ncbi:hypothetical protein NPIL_388491 [Nephila pilipes]|uniref:Uncharacterized protein n=1 Tax=Nephila pilipes TaxID=299642 RepID=A0A8X6QIM6_NEPPI|nr:hypothetical protein NPIL_388491 [Nephila pilipes]